MDRLTISCAAVMLAIGVVTSVDHVWAARPGPSVSLTQTPSNPTTEATATFKFTASRTSSAWCRVDSVGEWQNCTSGTITFTNLTVGSHSFWVGVYAATNASAGTGYNWTIIPPSAPPSPPKPTLEVYSGPGANTYLSNLYAVEVFDGSIWRSSYTYKYSRMSVTPWHQGASPSVNFTTFGTTGPVNVRIRKLGGFIGSVDISPKSKNIQAAVNNSQASFTLNQNNKVWIIINGDDANPLFIFADAPKPPVPAPGPGLKYFGPGVQTINHYKATSNQVIYLDGGAWVRGNIDITGTTNVQIMGPGVLSGDLWVSEDLKSLPFDQFTAYAMIRGDWGGNKASVKGITIVASPGYNFYSGASTVYSLKILSPWFYSTDGFQAVDHIDQSFVFTGDNAFFPIWAGVNQDNITITNSFAGTTANAVFCGGFWGNPANNTYTSLVDNIDIKTYGNPPTWGVPTPNIFQIWVDNDNSTKGYSNQTYQNIRIEGNLNEPMAQLKNMVYPWGGANAYNPAFGNSSNLMFKNISLSGTQAARSEIKGLDVNNGFHNVTFDNLTINGTQVSSTNFSSYFEVNGYVSGLSFISR
jgi:hypothetical protein